MEFRSLKEENAENGRNEVLILNGGNPDSATDPTTKEVFVKPKKDPSPEANLEVEQSGSSPMKLLQGDDRGDKTPPQDDQTHSLGNQMHSQDGQSCTFDDRKRVLEERQLSDGAGSDDDDDDVLFDVKNAQSTNSDQPGGSLAITCGDAPITNTVASNIVDITTEECDPTGLELEPKECRSTSSQDPTGSESQPGGINGLGGLVDK